MDNQRSPLIVEPDVPHVPSLVVVIAASALNVGKTGCPFGVDAPVQAAYAREQYNIVPGVTGLIARRDCGWKVGCHGTGRCG